MTSSPLGSAFKRLLGLEMERCWSSRTLMPISAAVAPARRISAFALDLELTINPT